MIDILLNVWQVMEKYEFFYYVPALALVFGLFSLVLFFCTEKVEL